MYAAAWTEPPNHIKGLLLLHQTMEISCLPVSIDLTHLTMKSFTGLLLTILEHIFLKFKRYFTDLLPIVLD